MNEYEKYTIGLQPCGKFKPSLKIPFSPHFCKLCRIGLKGVEVTMPRPQLHGCLNCKNVHHENGYDSCDHYEKLKHCACVKCLTEESFSNKRT